MKECCFYNGKIIPLKKIAISPYDLGILRGYCVFDVMCTQNGKPFLLEEHWKRFLNSAKELGLIVPIAKEEYEKNLQKLIKLNGFKKSTIRTVLSGGVSSDGFSLENGKETFYILVEEFKALSEEYYQNGVGVMTINHSRHFPKAKIASYIMAIKNQARKKKAKALEIIYLDGGKALEAATSNFFIVKNGTIFTPKSRILLGITRNLVIRLARRNRLKVIERDIPEEELYSSDEVFLSATNKGIVPVVRIDGKKIGDGKVGEVTKKLMSIFGRFVMNY